MSASPTVRTALAAVTCMLLALLTVAAALPARASADRPLLLIGVPGLAWSDVQADPDLAALLPGTGGAAGSLVVRSTNTLTCPVDGWLALSAGTRASGPLDGEACRPPSEVTDAVVPQWQDYLAHAGDGIFTAELGLLGDTLAGAGIPATAIGPGAAVALATSDGAVERYESRSTSLEDQVATALAATELVVLDLGERLVQAQDRVTVVADLTASIDAALQGARRSGVDPVIMVSGISDDGEASRLRVLTIVGLGGGELIAPSTRQPGYVLATDQYPTILDVLGVEPPPSSAIGSVIGTAAAPAAEQVPAAVDRQRHADAQRPLIGGFFAAIVVLNLALYAVVGFGLRSNRWARALGDRRVRTLRTLRTAALTLAALPVASLLTNLLPWWRAEPPLLALIAGTAIWAAVIVAVALRSPWRRQPLGAAGVVAATTALVIGLDIVTGSRLQVGAIMGISPTVAGRFYGMNNTAFSLFMAAALVTATALANQLLLRGRRRPAGFVVAGLGVAAILIDGAPFWGADFGGPPALGVSFALLALLAAGVRLTIRRVVVVVLGAGAATMGIAFADWLRPAESRTHLGAFFADVLDGDLWPIIARKLDQNLSILLGNRPLTILAICGVLLVIFLLIRSVRQTVASAGGGELGWLSNGVPLVAMGQAVPMLGSGLLALAVAAGLGFAINDSGIAIPAIIVALSVPLLICAMATWMLDQTPADGGQSRPSARSTAGDEDSASETSAGDGSDAGSPRGGVGISDSATGSPSTG